MAKRGGTGRWVTVVIMILATVFVVVVTLNLSLGDKQIDWRLPHRMAVTSEQFPRSMSGLLGAALVPGNQVDALLNGEQIFPAMLAAIKSATRSVSISSAQRSVKLSMAFFVPHDVAVNSAVAGQTARSAGAAAELAAVGSMPDLNITVRRVKRTTA